MRQRKLGTFVARPRIHAPVLDIPDIPAEVTARGEPHDHALLARDVRRAQGADLAGRAHSPDSGVGMSCASRNARPRR